MSLRPATADDRPELLHLIDASVRVLSQPWYTQTQIETALKHVLGIDSQLVEDGTYYVIERDGAIVAAGGWSARRNPWGGDQVKQSDDPLLDPAVDAARIRAFYVHPAHTRQGLARAIYETCESAARARGFRRFELTATLPGLALYEALGFEAREMVDVPLAGGLTLSCVRMTRSLEAGL
jgi:GNAT superfamily N-acetyltransferase